jgi:RDD family
VGLRFPPSGFTDRTAARAGVRYASWLRRFGGAVIDALIVATINYLIGGIYSFTIGPIANSVLVTLALIALLSCTSIIYATLCLSKLEGQTPGMRAVQIRCTPVAGRRRITIPQALTRSIVAAFFTSTLPLFFLRPVLTGSVLLALTLLDLVAWLWPLIDQRRQTWWDHVAATVVLDDRGW